MVHLVFDAIAAGLEAMDVLFALKKLAKRSRIVL